MVLVLLTLVGFQHRRLYRKLECQSVQILSLRMLAHNIAGNVLRLFAGGILKFLSARTVAKFITKSSLLLLSLNKDFSARAIAETFTTAHC